MKRLFAIVALLAAFTFAQTNAISAFKTYDNGNNFVVDVTFTLDSTAGMATAVFKLPAGGYNYNPTYGAPITFKKKTVSTYGTPKFDAYLQGVFNGSTDTLTIDTLSQQSTTESDTMGVMTCMGTAGITQLTAPAYKLYLRCLNADVNSGKITLVFPKMYALKPY